jgi:hypothetical protein
MKSLDGALDIENNVRGVKTHVLVLFRHIQRVSRFKNKVMINMTSIPLRYAEGKGGEVDEGVDE